MAECRTSRDGNARRRPAMWVVAAVAAIAATSGCTKPLPKPEIDIAQLQSQSAGVVVDRTSSETCINPSPEPTDMSQLVVGFSQSENEQNPFRALETASVQAAADSVGVGQLLYANANGSQAKQVSDILSMLNQGAQAIIIAPLNSTGLQPAFAAAKEKGVPIVTIDRKTEGTACKDFLTFMGSDFAGQGARAADALTQATDGHATIAEIQGAYGSDVEAERTDGFGAQVAKHPDMRIVAQQSADWSTSKAQQVTERLLAANPDINAIYTQSDTMALGAMTAVRNYGKQAGTDVHIVSIDGSRDAVQYIPTGQIYAVVETNPRFGPAAFQALADWFAGKPVPQEVIMKDRLFTKENATEALDSGAAY